jgi:hypothetical protein
MILQIDDTADEIYFPDPHYGDEDGCFAIGGDLSIDRLLLMQGRKIGVISHVAEMMERIPAQVQVVKTGSGRSKVQVMGPI